MSFTSLIQIVVILVLLGLLSNRIDGRRQDLVGMPEMPDDVLLRAAILVFSTIGMLGIALGPAR